MFFQVNFLYGLICHVKISKFDWYTLRFTVHINIITVLYMYSIFFAGEVDYDEIKQ